MSANDLTLLDVIDDICERDGRCHRNAYLFIVGALGRTVETLPPERRRDPVRRHLTGGELLAGVLQLARQEFGMFAPTVFREWGVTSGEDVGRIVFQLVQSGQLSARPEDSPEDFHGGPDLMSRLAEPSGTASRHERPGRGSSAGSA